MKLRLRTCEMFGFALWQSRGVAASRSLPQCPGGALKRGSSPPSPADVGGGGWLGLPSAGLRGLMVQVWGHCAGQAQRPFVYRVVSQLGGVCGAEGRPTGTSRPPPEDHYWGRQHLCAQMPAGAKEEWEIVARESAVPPSPTTTEFQTPWNPGHPPGARTLEWQRRGRKDLRRSSPLSLTSSQRK